MPYMNNNKQIRPRSDCTDTSVQSDLSLICLLMYSVVSKSQFKQYFICIIHTYMCLLTLVLLSPDMPCLCKQCRSLSVGF